VIQKFDDILLRTGEKIVDADDLMALEKPMISQMPTEKPRATGHHNTLH
jgi:hypothetical protein